jgi:hypothetical protein
VQGSAGQYMAVLARPPARPPRCAADVFPPPQCRAVQGCNGSARQRTHARTHARTHLRLHRTSTSELPTTPASTGRPHGPPQRCRLMLPWGPRTHTGNLLPPHAPLGPCCRPMLPWGPRTHAGSTAATSCSPGTLTRMPAALLPPHAPLGPPRMHTGSAAAAPCSLGAPARMPAALLPPHAPLGPPHACRQRCCHPMLPWGPHGPPPCCCRPMLPWGPRTHASSAAAAPCSMQHELKG